MILQVAFSRFPVNSLFFFSLKKEERISITVNPSKDVEEQKRRIIHKLFSK